VFRATICTPSYSSDHPSKKKASSVLSLRSLVATVATFFVFAPVVLAVCASSATSIQLDSVAVAFPASEFSQNNSVSTSSKSSGLTTHCAVLDLLQLSNGILPSHFNVSQASWTPVSEQTLNVSSNKAPLYILSLDLSDSYRYKPATLFDQRTLLRV